jgi:hypothetical protein
VDSDGNISVRRYDNSDLVGATQPTGEKQKIMPAIPFTITEAAQAYLLKIGLTEAQINKLTPQKAQEIIKERVLYDLGQAKVAKAEQDYSGTPGTSFDPETRDFSVDQSQGHEPEPFQDETADILAAVQAALGPDAGPESESFDDVIMGQSSNPLDTKLRDAEAARRIVNDPELMRVIKKILGLLVKETAQAREDALTDDDILRTQREHKSMEKTRTTVLFRLEEAARYTDERKSENWSR